MNAVATLEQKRQLRRNGKSFWLASLFLPAEVAAEATMLYSFCRSLDDLADAAAGGENLRRLDNIRLGLATGNVTDPLMVDFIALMERRAVSREAALYLTDTLLNDAVGNMRIGSEHELVRYCYGAAGTVGLMMAPILGVTDPTALRHAVDLGIAMQLTNIARDVREDALLGRRYLPATWCGGISPDEIVRVSDGNIRGATQKKSLAMATRRVLELAEVFYISGARGFSAIPPAARFGIKVAANVYREIGEIIRRRGWEPSLDRAVVSFIRKLQIVLQVSCGQGPIRKRGSSFAETPTHPALRGLPGADR